MRAGTPSQAVVSYSRDSTGSLVVWYPSPLVGIAWSPSAEMKNACTFRSLPNTVEGPCVRGFRWHVFFLALKKQKKPKTKPKKSPKTTEKKRGIKLKGESFFLWWLLTAVNVACSHTSVLIPVRSTIALPSASCQQCCPAPPWVRSAGLWRPLRLAVTLLPMTWMEQCLVVKKLL